MFHIIYKTTNTRNNKIYIGYHFQKSDPYNFDGYLGSGKRLGKAIEKYGIDSFSRETLYVFENEKDALEKESELVNENFIQRNDVYNMTLGGGKPPSHKGKSKSDDHRRKIGASNKGRIISEETKAKIKTARSNQIISHSDQTKRKIADALIGKKHTEERKQKMSENHADVSGPNNPCFGKKGPDHPAFGTKRELIQCPHCERHVPVNTAKRWHFDNCKSRTARALTS